MRTSASRRSVVLAAWSLLAHLACGDPDGRPGLTGATGVTSATSLGSGTTTDDGITSASPASTADAAGDPTAATTGDTDTSTGGGTGVLPIDCQVDPQNPACACDDLQDGHYTLGPCEPACRDHLWRYALWVTSYNVKGTLGYGEHNGLALIATRYSYDPRFPADAGVAAPWRVGAALWALGDPVAAADQFRARTTAPGGEVYAPAVLQPGDADDLFAGEEHPKVPVLLPHPLVDAAALCDDPESALDRRFYNHGRTLAETVPDHAWDSFFERRDLIPIHLLAAFEVGRTHDGLQSGSGTDDQVRACLDVLDDGFCDARCGNCSYVLSTGFGVPLASVPANQIAGIPKGTQGPYQIDVDGHLAPLRDNFDRLEDGRPVWYVGGSSWGRADEVADYDPNTWPDPDPVDADPGAFMSVVGPITQQDPIPHQYDDAFTHCVDPAAWVSSQSPILTTSMISGRWGHNSNSDAEAELIHFLDCAADPLAAAVVDHWNASACLACGDPRQDGGVPTQAPCQDLTHTAWSYWEMASGIHNVDDLDPGRYSAVGGERVAVDHMSQVPDPICRWSGEPVYGM